MIRVGFSRENDRIVGITVSGHSGYAAAGEDIVCSAVTSAVRLIECIISDSMGYNADVLLSQQTVGITVKSPDDISDKLFHGFMLYIRELISEYPKYITEVQF